MPLPFTLFAPTFTPQARLASRPAGLDSPCPRAAALRRSDGGGSETRPYTHPPGRRLLSSFRFLFSPLSSLLSTRSLPGPRTPAVLAPTVAAPPPSSLKSQASSLAPPSGLTSHASSLPPEDFSSDEPPVFSPPTKDEYVRPPPKEEPPYWETTEVAYIHRLPPLERHRELCKLAGWARAELREALNEFMNSPPEKDRRCEFEDPFWDPTPLLAAMKDVLASKLQAYVREGSGHSVSQWWDILRAEDPQIGVRARLRNELNWLAAACTFRKKPTYPDLFAAVRHQRRLRGRTIAGRAWLWGYRYPQRLNLAAFKVTGKTIPALEAHMLQEILRTWTYDCTMCRLFPNPSPATAATAKPAQQQGCVDAVAATGAVEAADGVDGLDGMDKMDDMDRMDGMDQGGNSEIAAAAPALAVSPCPFSPTPNPELLTPAVQAVSPCPSSPTPNPQPLTPAVQAVSPCPSSPTPNPQPPIPAVQAPDPGPLAPVVAHHPPIPPLPSFSSPPLPCFLLGTPWNPGRLPCGRIPSSPDRAGLENLAPLVGEDCKPLRDVPQGRGWKPSALVPGANVTNPILSSHTLGLVGAGNMAEALLRGVLKAALLPAARVVACDVVPARRELFSRTLGVRTVETPREVVGAADLLVLCVKPQQVDPVLAEIRPAFRAETHLLISIAAGVPTSRLEKALPEGARVVRVMPNTPMLVGLGAAALCGGCHARDQDLGVAEALFSAASLVLRVEEAQLDAVTGLSGSGPAYLFYLVEAMVEAGVAEGLSREAALKLAARTCLGAAQMLETTGLVPEELRRRVTSPRGTTQAALEQLEAAGVKAKLTTAVRRAAERSRELGRGAS